MGPSARLTNTVVPSVRATSKRRKFDSSRPTNNDPEKK